MNTPDIRSTLRRKGHDLAGWEDNQLAPIEFSARAIRSGEPIFVSDALRSMVEDVLAAMRAGSRRKVTGLRDEDANT